MDTGKVVLAGLAGIAAGAILGILFAPEKGSRTRRQILNKGNDYAEDLKDKFDDMLETMSNKYESVMSDAEDMVNKGKSKYNEAKKETHNSTV
jgi:gas vesicle protein